jgi:hypothetical protein
VTLLTILHIALWFTSFCRVCVRVRVRVRVKIELGLQLGLELRFVKLLTQFMCYATDSVS